MLQSHKERTAIYVERGKDVKRVGSPEERRMRGKEERKKRGKKGTKKRERRKHKYKSEEKDKDTSTSTSTKARKQIRMTIKKKERKKERKTRQDRTGQDRTGQDRTGQGRTGQENSSKPVERRRRWGSPSAAKKEACNAQQMTGWCYNENIRVMKSLLEVKKNPAKQHKVPRPVIGKGKQKKRLKSDNKIIAHLSSASVIPQVSTAYGEKSARHQWSTGSAYAFFR